MGIEGGLISRDDYMNVTTTRPSEISPVVVTARAIDIGQGFHFSRAWLDENIEEVADMNVDAAKTRSGYLAGRITADSKRTKAATYTTKQVNDPETGVFDGFVIWKGQYVAPKADDGSEDGSDDEDDE